MLFQEPRAGYLFRRYAFIVLSLFVIGFVSSATLLAFALWAQMIDWGPAWRLNVETVELVSGAGVASGIVFTYLLITEGLSVRRVVITDTFIVSGKEPRFFKRF